jgi:hypothetical protein
MTVPVKSRLAPSASVVVAPSILRSRLGKGFKPKEKGPKWPLCVRAPPFPPGQGQARALVTRRIIVDRMIVE